MVSVSGVEIARLEKDIASKNLEIESIRGSWESLSFDQQIVAGGKILDAQREVTRLSARLAKLSGTATASMRGTLAKELKDSVLEAILTSDVMDKVRQLWAVQDPSSRLNFIRLGVEYGGSGVPTVSLTGETTRAGSGTKAPRKYWMVDGVKSSTKDVILRYGEKYGQTKAFADMTPDERVSFRDQIIAGEGLEVSE